MLSSLAMIDDDDLDDSSENSIAAKALVTNDLYAEYRLRVEELGSTDLVLLRDVRVPSWRKAMTREQCLADPLTPEFLKEKAARLPRESATEQLPIDASFWFAVFFPDDIIVLAVNGTRMAHGGSA